MKKIKRAAQLATAGFCLSIAVSPLAAQAPTIAPKTAPATHVTKDQIQDFIAKLPRGMWMAGTERAFSVSGGRM